MKIRHIIHSKRLFEGGNLSVRGYEADHLDLTKVERSYIVSVLDSLLHSIDSTFKKSFGDHLWSEALLKSKHFLSGSSLHFFNTAGVSDVEFVTKKPTVGDMDTMVSKEKETDLQKFLTDMEDRKIGPATLRGFQRGNEQFSSLWELSNPPITVQIDFEFVKFDNDSPTEWARFSHSSAWEDLQAGVKGVFHKWLIQSFTALTKQEFYLRKLVGRGKARTEQDILTTDNMYSFAVSSKEGGGLRAKYEPVIDPETGRPEVKDGKPVMKAAPTSGYQQDIGQIFTTVLGKRLSPDMTKAMSHKFWSFTGLVDVMKELLTSREKQEVLRVFLQKTIGPAAQGMYKNNPDKDIAEKTTAINYLLSALGMTAPADLKQMVDTYRASYKMTDAGETSSSTDVVKDMAKNALSESTPSYKRKGVPHIYNPGSSAEIKDKEFIELCKTIHEMGGILDNLPINLKVDGAGIRFGKDERGKPFFMTSKVTEPKYIENYGDFEEYGKLNGQSEERLALTRQYDEALKLLLTSDMVKDLPSDTIVQAEMLFLPMGQKTEDGIKFVHVPYEQAKLGNPMTIVPFSIREYSTGETSPHAKAIKKKLLDSSTKNLKVVNNRLSQSDIDVSNIVDPIANHATELQSALISRSNPVAKEKAKDIISTAKKLLSDAIIESPNIQGKDQLGNNIEGLVVNFPNGQAVKVTSQFMKSSMAAKKLIGPNKSQASKRTKPAVVTIGSFAGHRGHQQLIDQTIATAQKVGGDPYVYVSPVTGSDDPIPPSMKVATLKKLYPEYANNIQVWDPAGNAVKKIEKELVLPASSPYNKIILLVGSDRYDGFKKWMDSLERRMKDPVALAKYGGTQDQVDFETVRTERDAEKGGTGISFTMLRDILKDPSANEEDKLALWTKAFDTDKLGIDWVKNLMDTTARNMQLQTVKETLFQIKPLIREVNSKQRRKIQQIMESASRVLNKNEFAATILHESSEVGDYVRAAVIPEMRKCGVPSRPLENMWTVISSMVFENKHNSEITEFVDVFRKLDQRKKIDIRIGQQISILNLQLSAPDFATLYGFKTPKTITKIYREPSEKKIVQLEFNNDPEDVWPRQPHAKFNGKFITDSIILPDAKSVDHALTLINLHKPTNIKLRTNILENITMSESKSHLYSKTQARIIKELENGYFLGNDSYDDDEGFEKQGFRLFYKQGGNQYRLVGNINVSPYNPSKREIATEIARLMKNDQLRENDALADGVKQALHDPATHDIMAYAAQHYPEEPDLQAAFVKFVLKSLKHSKQDDQRQDDEIADLNKEVSSMKTQLSKKDSLDEAVDYIDEK